MTLCEHLIIITEKKIFWQPKFKFLGENSLEDLKRNDIAAFSLKSLALHLTIVKLYEPEYETNVLKKIKLPHIIFRAIILEPQILQTTRFILDKA